MQGPYIMPALPALHRQSITVTIIPKSVPLLFHFFWLALQ